MTGIEAEDKGGGKARRASSPRRAAASRGDGGDAAPSERLQKVLAARGVASRRAAEELILEGRVTVDGRVVTELGTKVDPTSASIKVGGRLLKQPRLTYLLLNKPRGYITTASDPEGRRTVYDLLDAGATRERVYPVGRLDMDSEGLLLMTNDGELANRIAHPRYRMDKEYNALVAGTPTSGALVRAARGGVLTEGGRTSPSEVSMLGSEGGESWLKVIIHEGRKHQVRRMMEEIGHPVRRLRRVRLGPLTLAGLPAASYRPLGPEELLRLRRMVGLAGETVPVAEQQPEQRPRQPAPAQRPAQRPERPERTPTYALGAVTGSVRAGGPLGNRAERQPDRVPGTPPGRAPGRPPSNAPDRVPRRGTPGYQPSRGGPSNRPGRPPSWSAPGNSPGRPPSHSPSNAPGYPPTRGGPNTAPSRPPGRPPSRSAPSDAPNRTAPSRPPSRAPERAGRPAGRPEERRGPGPGRPGPGGPKEKERGKPRQEKRSGGDQRRKRP